MNDFYQDLGQRLAELYRELDNLGVLSKSEERAALDAFLGTHPPEKTVPFSQEDFDRDVETPS